MSKIMLCTIFKDDSEYEHIERMLASFMPHCHGLVAVLTGVSGEFSKLKKLVKQYNGVYVQASPQTHPQIYAEVDGKPIFANFAAARNVSFEKAALIGGYDWWLWADADDVLINGHELQPLTENADRAGIDAVFCTYWYSVSLNEKGDIQDVIIDHLRERLLRANVFKWTSRLHEVCVPIQENYQYRNSLYDFNPKEGRTLVWAHLAGKERMEQALQRNIQILKIQVEEEQYKDPRTVFYLAKTYYDLNDPQYDATIEEYITKYLELSGWDEERSNACEYLGNLYARKGDHRGAVECYHNAIKEYPNRHMPYLLLAKEYSEMNLMEHSTFWLNQVALKLEEPKTRTTIGNPLEVKLLAASLKYNEAIRTQRLDDAISWLKIRNQLMQVEDSGMIQVLEETKQANNAAIAVFNYAKWLKEKGHVDKVKHLLQSLPSELGREPFAHFIANEVNEPRVWGEDEICYYASWGTEHFEGWSPKSLEKGIGGSETAVIQLAKRWVQKGYKVTVYGDPREQAGVHDGVTYRPWYEINWKDHFNILILWRSPHLLDREIKAKKLFMDLHDIVSSLDYGPERVAKLDKVFFKSTWHRKQIPQLPEEKAMVISNGI